jgi:hypothetical protein
MGLNGSDEGLLKSLDKMSATAASAVTPTGSSIAAHVDHLRTPRDVQEIELSGMIGSIARLAYHLGAIRQINRTLRGPAESSR